MSFSLVNERIEQTTISYHTRAPIISFVSEVSGSQYIEVKLTDAKAINGKTASEEIVNTVTILPEELNEIELIHPLTGLPVLVDGDTLKMDVNYVYMILYTIFKKAVSKNEEIK